MCLKSFSNVLIYIWVIQTLQMSSYNKQQFDSSDSGKVGSCLLYTLQIKIICPETAQGTQRSKLWLSSHCVIVISITNDTRLSVPKLDFFIFCLLLLTVCPDGICASLSKHSNIKIQNICPDNSKFCDVNVKVRHFTRKICPSVQIFAEMQLIVPFFDDLTFSFWLNRLRLFEAT